MPTKEKDSVSHESFAADMGTASDSNQLIIVPGTKKRRAIEDCPLPKKKDATGGKKSKNFAKEKEKEKITKKMKRQLAAVKQRKEKKITQEELFASLAEYQLDSNKLKQLGSTIHMQDKDKKIHSDEHNFPDKIKTFSGKINSCPTIHQKERIQENYYPTDCESSDEEDDIHKDIVKSSPLQNKNTTQDTTNIEVTSKLDMRKAKCEIEKASLAEMTQAVKNKDNKFESTELGICKTKLDAKLDVLNETLHFDAVNSKHLRNEKQNKEEELTRCSQETSKLVHRKHVLVTRDPNIEKKRSQLPIYSEEVPIIEQIQENIVTVVCGETGSGKTTQIPQFLFESGYANDGQIIGITEPRRVAAISMAQRVGEELGMPDKVSYQIRYEGNRSDHTRILFMTDGVLMKEMETDIMLKKYSIILIDEAHERSMYSDVLIGMLSRIAPLRAKTSNPLKLVIMSATLRLADFMHKRLFPIVEPKVIKIESRQFPVTVHFEKRTPDNYMVSSFRKVCRIHESLPSGAILVFVSGQQEVRQLLKKLCLRYPVRYETSKDGEKLVRGGKKWQKKKVEEAKNLKLEDFREENIKINKRLDGEDLMETGVGEDIWDEDTETLEDNDDDWSLPLSSPPANSPPLYCLPLYSLLSTEKQKRVFQPPPEGARMCVISTNIAETSLTIPGVKYVVDSGFEKRRLYDPITGVSQFVVSRISQASADQRAGRAGRVVAGHAYRLYSSAVFQDFPKFSSPEIMNKPADQLVLHLKSMNIVKVVNFPFPSAPDPEVLEAAEERLLKLGALSQTTRNEKTEARITPLGKTLSVFPLSPSYAKVIAMANQHNLMPHAILLIAALSVREPMTPVSSIRGTTELETKEKMTDILKLRRSWCGKGPARRLGDLLVLMRAVTCSEKEKMNPIACERMGIRSKAMMEVRRLRSQLTNIVNTSFKSENDIIMDQELPSPTDAQAQMLRQMMVAGLADRIARRVDRAVAEEDVPKGAYQTLKLKDYVFIDPCSVIYTEEPDYVLFQEIVQIGEKKCMQTIMTVDHEWLPRLAKEYCRFGEMDKNVEPRYDSTTDQIVKNVNVWFGTYNWSLGSVDKPLPLDINIYRYFAQFLLDGKVMPLLAEYVPKMLAPPTTMIRLWAKLQIRTEKILNALVDKEVHCRSSLIDEWHRDENYLLEEYLMWIPESLHATISLIWPPLEDKSSKMGRNKIYTK